MKIDWFFALLLIVVVHFTALACQAQIPEKSHMQIKQSGVQAEVKMAKIHIQVELAGHCGNVPSISPKHCAARPWSTQVTIWNTAGQQIKVFQTDADGIANIELAAGTYKFATQGSRFMSSSSQTINVLANTQHKVLLSVRPMVR